MADFKDGDVGVSKDLEVGGPFKDPTHTASTRDDFMRNRANLDAQHRLPITSSRNAKW